MCRVFTFHHLCGHIHSTRVLPCPSPTPYTSASPACHALLAPDPGSRILAPSPSCADTTQNPHLYPTLCDSCKEIGVISEWFEKTPGARFEAIMEWRRADGRECDRKGRSRSNSHSAGSAALADGKYRVQDAALEQKLELESLPFIRFTDDDSQSSSSNGDKRSRGYSAPGTTTTGITNDNDELKPRASLALPDQNNSVNVMSDTSTGHTLSARFQSTRVLLERMNTLNQRMRKRIQEARLPLPCIVYIPTTSSAKVEVEQG